MSINIFTFRNIHKAYLDCRKNKRNTKNAIKFEINLESEILKLKNELNNQTYTSSRFICFVIKEPMLREIFASDFRDRVIHHLLYNFLEPIFEKKFIFHSYSNRKEKGAHKSIKYLNKFIRQVTKNYKKEAFFIHLDIKGFFMNINKITLFEIILKNIKNKKILWLTKQIIFCDPLQNFHKKGDKNLFQLIPKHKSLFYLPNTQGLPIGNLTSQFFANVYLNELDQFVKHKLKAKYYMRYVDDFVILSKDKNELIYYRNEISQFLKYKLALELNPKKQVLQSINNGINWLGYIIKNDYILSRRRVVNNLKRKLNNFNKILEEFEYKQNYQMELYNFKKYPDIKIINKILATINSYYGHFRHANTYNLRKNLYENRFLYIKNYIENKDSNFYSFKIKKDFLKNIKRAKEKR